MIVKRLLDGGRLRQRGHPAQSEWLLWPGQVLPPNLFDRKNAEPEPARHPGDDLQSHEKAQPAMYSAKDFIHLHDKAPRMIIRCNGASYRFSGKMRA